MQSIKYTVQWLFSGKIFYLCKHLCDYLPFQNVQFFPSPKRLGNLLVLSPSNIILKKCTHMVACHIIMLMNVLQFVLHVIPLYKYNIFMDPLSHHWIFEWFLGFCYCEQCSFEYAWLCVWYTCIITPMSGIVRP